MPAYTFFHPSSLTNNSPLTLEGEEARHLSRVMRVKEGETVRLINGKGVAAEAAVEQIEKRVVHLRVLEREEQPPPTPVILAFAIPRMPRIDGIIEKGTELGVTEFWPFPGERSEKRMFSKQQLERCRSIALSATKQCGRLWLPEIALKPPIKEWTACPQPAYFGDLSPEAPLLYDCLEEGPVLFVTGPEAGFMPAEEEKLASLNVKGVRIHSSILRTDTASIAALALLTHRRNAPHNRDRSQGRVHD